MLNYMTDLKQQNEKLNYELLLTKETLG